MMKKYTTSLVLAFALFIVPVFAAPPTGAPTVNDEEAWVPFFPKEVRQLKDGKIAVRRTTQPGENNSTTNIIVAAFIADVHIDEAYRILKEADKQHEYTKMLLESKIVFQNDEYMVVYSKIKFMIWNFEHQTVRRHDDSKYRIWWSLDPDFDNSFARFNGYYQLYYMDDDHTLVKYGVDMIITVFIPAGVQQSIIRNDLPRGLDNIRKRINSHGQYRVKK